MGFKTVYSRLFVSFIAIVLVVMSVLAVVLGAMFQTQFLQERVDEMMRETEEINRIMAQKYWPKENREVALEELDIIARKYSALVQVFDKNGAITITDPQKRTEWESSMNESSGLNAVSVMHQGYFEDILDGAIIQTKGYFSQTLSEPVMTVGRPLMIEEQIVGAIFMHQKIGDIENSVNQIYRNVVLASMIALGCAIVLAMMLANAFTRPLVQMNKEAKNYAKGKFSGRVDVKTEDEIGELALSLNTMANDLESLEDMRSSFVANVSHELKAPLASMRGFVQALLDGSVPRDDMNEYLTIVMEEAIRLSAMINDLLDLSKIESGKFPLHCLMFDINNLVTHTALTFEQRILEKQIELEFDYAKEHIVVEADQDRIAQVVTNLLDNAIKYTEHGGSIFISTRTLDSMAYVSIRDTGTGIPEIDQPFIFERFFKVDKAHTPGIEGTGLGLSIAKKIIDSHGFGCEISFTSKLTAGSTFTFSLPLAMQKLNKQR